MPLLLTSRLSYRERTVQIRRNLPKTGVAETGSVVCIVCALAVSAAYAYKKLSFVIFAKGLNFDEIKKCFNIEVFKKIDKKLIFNDSLKRLLFKQLDIN